MFGRLIKGIPEKQRILFFLVSTSFIGVCLILISVYNASNELEIIYEIENTHRFAEMLTSSEQADEAHYQHLLSLDHSEYQFYIIQQGEVMLKDSSRSDHGWDMQLASLYESRVNEKGGYMEIGQQVITWAMLPLARDDQQLLVLHRFASSGNANLSQVYIKRMLVPAIFYVWLMVWMGYIVRYLTGKLSEQKQAMEHMALHDTLTGLPNRNLLNDRLNNMLEVSKRKKSHFSIVMMDLDGFKVVNDTHGHAIGDLLLKEIAQRIKSCLRANDTVCRLGGDEFIFLLDDKQRNTSLEICKRIFSEIAKPVVINDLMINVGSSMGLVYIDHDERPEDLIHKSDEAMYKAKANGGGIHIYRNIVDSEHVERVAC